MIAGGGFAALETALALRALADDRVSLTLVAPEPVLRYRPAATTELFNAEPPRSYDLRVVARHLDAELRIARGSRRWRRRPGRSGCPLACE